MYLAQRCASECVGTFMLVLIGPGAAMMNARTGGGLGTAGVALAFALVVTTVVAVLGRISGAHINPAVTVAFWFARRFPGAHVFPYLIAQCAGAILAAIALRQLLGNIGNLGATLPLIGGTRTFAVEFVLSCFLMLVIICTGTLQRRQAALAAPLIGLAVGLCALVAGPLTGASMNPARSLGPALVGDQWHGHWIYWVAPIAGMLAAVGIARSGSEAR